MRNLDPETQAALEQSIREVPSEGLRAMSHAVDSRAGYFPGHSDAVIYLLRMMAAELDLGPIATRDLLVAGLLHDVGKLRVPIEILLAPRPLNDREAKIMRMHPIWSAEMAETSGCTPEAVNAILHHHEHEDGTGYPEGLAGEDIPWASRLILVADTFQVMTTDRPYRRGVSRKQATAELRALAGKQFDPAAVELLVGDRAGWTDAGWTPRGAMRQGPIDEEGHPIHRDIYEGVEGPAGKRGERGEQGEQGRRGEQGPEGDVGH